MEMTEFSFKHYILRHLYDSQQWHLPFLPSIHLPYPLSSHALMVCLGSLLLIVFFCLLYRKKERVPRGLSNVIESMVEFIRDQISIACLGREEGLKMTPFFCTLFFFILFLNFLGLIPLFASATANFNVTGALALVIFSIMIFGAIYKNGLFNFLKSFFPPGFPWPAKIFIGLLEFLSVFIKTFALMIRLFANMLGGHLTITVLIGLVAFLGYIALPVIVIALFIYLLEVLIAFIQAYVFTLLSAIFIAQIHHPEH